MKNALLEDVGFRDITTDSIVGENDQGKAEVLVKEDGVLAGMEIFRMVFTLLDPEVKVQAYAKDGDRVHAGQVIATVEGRMRALLTGERTALNFIQYLSGIASVTHQAVELVKDYPCRIVDTRKTTPGLRGLAKYAVKVGGGLNHRLGLFDAVLIKDNHIEAAGSINEAVRRARQNVGAMVKIEVETESLDQVKEALACLVDVIMLDNMTPQLMTQAVKLIGGRALTEASGGLRLSNLTDVAATGVDLISLGWLTHSAPALDISMNIF